SHLAKGGIKDGNLVECLKWLRFFLDFCHKYKVSGAESHCLYRFLEKVRGKNQSNEQLRRASRAVSLYFEMRRLERASSPADQPRPHKIQEPSLSTLQQLTKPGPPSPRVSQYSEAGYQVNSDSLEWDEVIATLAAEIKVRHYSRKTLKTYALWVRKFQRFLKNKSPRELSTDDVKDYLTWLAVKCSVAASTQNQAFNALLFFFRHALKKDFGVLKDVPRAKKSLYVPMVLSREEIDAILKELRYPFNLVVNLLFGC
ncbi:MAG: integron integrase, partial [Deltaproteobacteria bacterium]|nr:integron integrase [Deltaproteobacteria bacterium]